MKKSTLILGLFLAAGAWSGMAFANDSEGGNETTGSETAKSVTFDFTTNQYGYEATNDSKSEYVKNATFTEGDVTITVDANTGNGMRMWQAASGVQCRVYKQAIITITAPEAITSVSATAGNGLSQLTSTNVTVSEDATEAAATYTITEPATTVTFTTTGTVQFTSITVNCGVSEGGETPNPGTDDIDAARKAAIEEIAAYYEVAGMYADPAYLDWMYGDALKAATTLEEVAAVVEKAKNEVSSQMLNYLTANFMWKSGEGFSTFADGKYTLSSTVTTGSLWVAERLFEPSYAPWSEGEGGYEVPAEYSENSFRLKNLLSGQYLAPISADGQVVTGVDSEKEAGVFVVLCADKHLCIADDVNRSLTLGWGNDGLTVVTTNATFVYQQPNVWKEQEIHIEIEGSTMNEYGGLEPVEQIKNFKLYVPKGAQFSGFGEVSIKADDPVTYERYTIEAWSWETLKNTTPEQGTWTKVTYEPAPTEENPWNYERVEHQVEADIYSFSLHTDITSPGYYYIFTTEGMWYTEEEGQIVFAKDGGVSAEIKGDPAAAMVLDITPADGAELTSISTVTIKGGEGVNPAVCWNSDADLKIAIYNEAKNCNEAEWTKDEVNNSNTAGDSFTDPNVYELKLAQPITAAGTYTLVIPAGFFEDDQMNQNGDTAVIWVVNEEGGILNVESVSTNAAAYDLQGRKINGNARGMIITKGHKQIIK